MTYNYEALTPEKFQHFCQALLLLKFPDTQCLPVGQPDGGRDAFVLSREPSNNKKAELTVFQVKFSRNPERPDDEFLQSILSKELPKVENLKKRGLTAYYLLTNVRGTAHLDVGSVDKVNAILSEALDVPAYCWWRDDLDRKVDAAPNIKWSFPEIIRGSDLLQALLEGVVGEDGRRRDDAIKAYIAAQYRDDREVKFKQVDLFNSLLDLFVDTNLGTAEAIDQGGPRNFSNDFPRTQPLFRWRHGFNDDAEPAAAFLLQTALSSQRIVLEGAPGQGKSTITQYICQVQRMRLLDMSVELAKIPSFHLAGTVRIPMRVDLRDYASWIAGKNPFAGDMNAPRPQDIPTSLEGFLSFQISQVSGGHTFSVSDLSAISRQSHLLIVLDGFDEVADIPTREQVVREISKSFSRLETASKSLHIVVTSRPAAFAKSPGFSQKEWRHLTLHSMTLEQINLYADKWMRARQLPTQEQEKFRQVLREKLEQAHMRDLARNPMQLAILLNLIQTRGLSLPDKRTALYDSYMELFFSREAEKSSIVREHRDLLVELHRYLAWVIQTEAEELKSQGSVTEDKLKELLRSYLSTEGHESSLVDELFTGMVERVVALVSRVQGTFEFEVQPLREYFAARHLYETAPYSPPGRERKGTKPERFDALAGNFYWLNVTRFYCGCYSRGELSSLADGLIDLSKTTEMKLIGYPRVLTSMLLGDWVFTQQPHIVKRLTSNIVTQPGFKILLANVSQDRGAVSLIPPERCGRGDLLSTCKKLFLSNVQSDVLIAMAGAIRTSVSYDAAKTFWMDLQPTRDNSESWMLFGRHLGLFAHYDSDEFAKLYSEVGKAAIWHFALVSRYDLIETKAEFVRIATDFALSNGGGFLSYSGGAPETPFISQLGNALDITAYSLFFERSVPSDLGPAMKAGHSFRSLVSVYYQSHEATSVARKIRNKLSDGVERFLRVYKEAIELPAREWMERLRPWSMIVEAGMSEWQSQPVFFDIALIAAGVTSKEERGSFGAGISDSKVSLCESVRFARLKSGAPQWWVERINAAEDQTEIYQLVTTLLYWGTPRTISLVSTHIETIIDKLDNAHWARLFGRIKRSARPSKLSSASSMSEFKLIKSDRLIAILSLRLPLEQGDRLVSDRLKNYKQSDAKILEVLAESLLRKSIGSSQVWSEALPIVKRGYAGGGSFDRVFGPRRSNMKEIPVKVAMQICKSAQDYPLTLVQHAQAKLTERIGTDALPPGAISRKDGWFSVVAN